MAISFWTNIIAQTKSGQLGPTNYVETSFWNVCYFFSKLQFYSRIHFIIIIITHVLYCSNHMICFLIHICDVPDTKHHVHNDCKVIVIIFYVSFVLLFYYYCFMLYFKNIISKLHRTKNWSTQELMWIWHSWTTVGCPRRHQICSDVPACFHGQLWNRESWQIWSFCVHAIHYPVPANTCFECFNRSKSCHTPHLPPKRTLHGGLGANKNLSVFNFHHQITSNGGSSAS